MPFAHGKTADIVVDGVRIATIMRSMAFAADVDTAETSTFLQNWKSFLAGQGGATVELEGLYDDGVNSLNANPRASLFSDAGVVTIGPAGLAFGALARLMDRVTSNYTESASVGDAVMATWSLQTDGEVGLGNVYRGPDQGAVTATGNGTSIDLGAQVVGAVWVFHAHVLSLAGTTPGITLKVQDSADNAAFADLAGATTTAITAAGAQRITGTGTVRRYVRVVHTVTGTTPSIVYTAAFSRRLP